jgi:hypothetical protein
VVADKASDGLEWDSIILRNELERFPGLFGCPGSHMARGLPSASALGRAHLIRHLGPLNRGRVSRAKFINDVRSQRGHKRKCMHNWKSLTAAFERARPQGGVVRHLHGLPRGNAGHLVSGVEAMAGGRLRQGDSG